MSEIALLGAGGMLGRTWREQLAARGRPFEPLTHADLDITDADAIARVLGDAPRVIVNCVAHTDVDGAETDEARADAVNGHAVRLLAAHAARTGSLLVHFSTDYVFDGAATAPYAVDHPRSPVNAYGRSKALGERALEASGARFLNVRTSWLYAPWSKNFVRTIAALAKTRPSLSVVADQRGRPTSTHTLVDKTLSLMGGDALGTFHVTDGGECSWFDLATEIAQRVAPACVVEPCTSEAFPRPAKRPAYSVLDVSATEARIGALPHFTEALSYVLETLE